MSALRSRSPVTDSTTVAISLGAALAALLVGVLMGVKVQLGLGLLMALCYLPVLVYAPMAGLVVFVPLVFLEAVPALNLGGKAAGALVVVAWFGAVMSGRVDVSGLAARRTTVGLLLGLILWLSLSVAWARSPGAAFADLWHWYAVGLLFAVVATSVDTESALKYVLGAFVAGAVLSVVIGYSAGLVDTGSALQSAAEPDARLEGATGDPNFLAAALVAAVVIAAGLMVAVEHALARIGLAAAIGICVLGMAASQSRGGFIAVAVAIASAFLFFRRSRLYVTVAVLGILGVGAVYFSASPAAWQRITAIDAGGSGRSDLWTVAWRVSKDHPVLGIGLNNYELVAKDYTRLPGALKDVRKIAEDPHVVHNTYLQLLAENGILGALLFLAFAGSCLRTAWLAGMRFEEAGDAGLEALARAVLVGTIGMLAASFFISGAVDKRLWILFALGPALLALAERQTAPPAST